MKSIEPVWIEGINTKAVGRGIVKQSCEDINGNIISITLHNVLFCLELGQR